MPNSASDSKSILEIVLMPIAIAVVGIAGSMIIANAQIQNNVDLNKQNIEAAKQRANEARELRVVEIFLQGITDPDAKKRQAVLMLLELVEGNLAVNLANFVKKNEPLNSPTRLVAEEEGAKAAQRVASASMREEPGMCEKYASYNSSTWKSRFQKEVQVGTWHVFVASLPLGSTKVQAEFLASDFSKKNPKLAFEVMQTIGFADNVRYGIVVATGLDRNTARDIATYADKCGIAKGAYPFQQSI